MIADIYLAQRKKEISLSFMPRAFFDSVFWNNLTIPYLAM